MSDKNHSRHFGGKGYTVALLLCAAAIGIGGYAYYSSTAGADPAQQVNAPVAVTESQRQTRPASTAPTGGTTQTTPATAPTTGKLHTCTPVEGEILAEYAMECLSYNQTTRDWRVHNGVDLAAEAGTQVHAAADGKVYTVYEDDQMGTTVVIRHDGGYTTKYASLAQEVSVAAGDSVRMGDAIGCVGSTALMEQALGDHVHFSVTKNDEPVDPKVFLGQ